jgi:hypothetical protein
MEPMASDVDQGDEGDTFETEVDSCIPLALAFVPALSIVVAVVGSVEYMAKRIEQMERLIRKHLIVVPILLRMLY